MQSIIQASTCRRLLHSTAPIVNLLPKVSMLKFQIQANAIMNLCHEKYNRYVTRCLHMFCTHMAKCSLSAQAVLSSGVSGAH